MAGIKYKTKCKNMTLRREKKLKNLLFEND